MKGEVNYQDTFLNKVRQERVPLTVFLTNGFQMRGILRGFDHYVILLDCDGKQEMIYKHAISTVIPMRHLELFSKREREVMPTLPD
jgi:host factor-I protein